MKNIDNYGQIVKEIFKETTKWEPSLSKQFVKRQLELRLNITEVESDELLTSLLKEETGLINESYHISDCVEICGEYYFNKANFQ